MIAAVGRLKRKKKIGAKTHYGGGVLSAFVFPLVAIARELALNYVGSTALRKDPPRL